MKQFYYVKRLMRMLSLTISMFLLTIIVGCSCEHVWTNATTITVATCTHEGEISLTCEKCGKSVNEKTPLESHRFEKQSTTATCTLSGTASYKCAVCGKEKKENEFARGHVYDDYICQVCYRIDPSLKLYEFNKSLSDFNSEIYAYNGDLSFFYLIRVGEGKTDAELTAILQSTYTQYGMFRIHVVDATLKKKVLYCFGGDYFKNSITNIRTWNYTMNEPYNSSHTYYIKVELSKL